MRGLRLFVLLSLFGLALASHSAHAQTTAQNQAFDRYIAAFKARQTQHSQTFLDQAFRGIRLNTDVLERDANQAEFRRTLEQYVARAVSDKRLKNGQRAFRKNARTLAAIEARYGVDAEILAAIWGLESTYGEVRGDIPVIEATATLAFDGRRRQLFESQLRAALRILASGDVTRRNFTGSWAGAMGHTQFIPTSFEAYAVDFDGDGKRNIWSDDPTDALASTAAYLRRFGWQKEVPWGIEVRLPSDFNTRLIGKEDARSGTAWAALGVQSIQGRRLPSARAWLIAPVAGGPVFLVTDNYTAILRYNNAQSYAISVGHLADRIAGGGPIQTPWPRVGRALSIAEVKELQQRLNRAGFDAGSPDGLIGPQTRAAIRAFQEDQDLTPSGAATIDLLTRMR